MSNKPLFIQPISCKKNGILPLTGKDCEVEVL